MTTENKKMRELEEEQRMRRLKKSYSEKRTNHSELRQMTTAFLPGKWQICLVSFSTNKLYKSNKYFGNSIV